MWLVFIHSSDSACQTLSLTIVYIYIYTIYTYHHRGEGRRRRVWCSTCSLCNVRWCLKYFTNEKTREVRKTYENQLHPCIETLEPKQQELRIPLRTRFGLEPYKGPFWSRTLKTFKKHWFYRLGQKKYQTSTGFIDRVPKSIQQALVL